MADNMKPTITPVFTQGIHVDPEFNTTMPNYLMDCPKWWIPKDGGRPPSVFAAIIYQWLTDKATKIVEFEGTKYGQVLGGKSISFYLIADNLGISWSSVQRNLKYLVDVGLITRARTSRTKEYSYAVPNCRKTFKDKEGSQKLNGKPYNRDTPKAEIDFLDETKTTNLEEGEDEILDENDYENELVMARISRGAIQY